MGFQAFWGAFGWYDLEQDLPEQRVWWGLHLFWVDQTCSACSGLEAGADRAVSLYHSETWRELRFWSQMIKCIRFWVGFIVPYTVTMVTHTHFEECTKFGIFFTKMCSVSGVPFGWQEAAPCAPAVRSCSRSYQPNAPLVWLLKGKLRQKSKFHQL